MIIYGVAIDHKTNKIFVMPPVGDPRRVGDIDDFDTGVKKSARWMPPSVEWFDDDGRNIEKYKDPDISYISVASNLILSPHVSDIVKSAVSDVAELLPVSFNGKIWSLFNVYNVINAVDKSNSQYTVRKNGEVGRLKKLAFLTGKVPHAKLFKVPERRSRIYFAEHHPDDSENNFKNIIEKNNLFGIKFVKVWEG